jgi:hypothetical protein
LNTPPISSTCSAKKGNYHTNEVYLTCSVYKCSQERNLPFFTIFTVMQMQGNDHVMQQTLLPANMTRISIIKNHQTHLTQE